MRGYRTVGWCDVRESIWVAGLSHGEACAYGHFKDIETHTLANSKETGCGS